MNGIIGKKIGMTSIFDDKGKNIPCTIIEAGPCVVTQIKTEETDGYNAFQLAYEEAKEKNTPAPMKGHFSKASTTPKKKVLEFRDCNLEKGLGDTITVDDVLEENQEIEIVGTSKGKGFQGVVKRHGFGGVGMRTHGQHNRERSPGSIGAASYPARVFKGMKMAGRTGNDRITLPSSKVLKLIPSKNLIIVSGSVPGAKGSYVVVKTIG